ncbi:MAG TPA: caspase family protein [Streptomyces sp.]|uniref:caspase family protein n=1 Tax=Streptomyces sp. TaxID=1931 RepID=UPI002B9CFD2F|nr:caspase family protein [Streptomyces sp.]HWU07900.1 caspase family protein [Streptomyces sp.]
MPPYNARGEENRAKRHRAVLIGVEHYAGNRNDLPAVTTNLRLMREALTADRTGVLGPEDLVVVPTGGDPAAGVDPLRVRAVLTAARKEVTGLLVVYFAGHGIVRPDGSDLNLMFTDSAVLRDQHHSFLGTLSWRDDVMPELRSSHADWVVVILDCCFAGNALAAFSPATEQNFALLTAAERGVEIPPGDPRTGTEFTAALHRLLTAGEGEPVTFTRIVTGIREAMSPLKAVDGHRWIPDELRHGDDVVLALAADREHAEPSPAPLSPVSPSPVPTTPAPAAPTSTTPAPTTPAPTTPAPTTPAPAALTPTAPTPTAPTPTASDSSAVAPRLPQPRPGWWQRLTAFPRRLLRGKVRHLTRTTAFVLAGVVALAGAGAWYFLSPAPVGGCDSPLELRVLTDPDLLSTVQKAADAYSKRDVRGCRSVGINVYDAKATDAVAAFRSSSLWQDPPAACPASGDCLRPQRDVGAQPDIWIPAAGSAWQRATADGEGGGGTASAAAGTQEPAADAGKSVVDLGRLGSIAYTPMVLGVPDTMILARALQTDDPLGEIVSALEEAQDVDVLRPDPEGTEGALLATDALYAASRAGGAAAVEQGMATALRPMPSTARELMCLLADGSHNDLEDRAAVLVPEQTLAQFNLSAGEAGRPACATEALKHRVAHYPSDVPMLDLPFVRVTWDGADRDADDRRVAVEDFYDWLATDPVAQKCFTDDGFRGVEKSRPAPPDDGSVLREKDNATAVREQLPKTGQGADVSASLNDTLSRYRGALGPGRVLYLLDNSTSMADKRVWDGTGGAKELVARSMHSLGTGDSYGVWETAVEDGEPATDLVPFGPQTTAGVQKAVAGARTAGFDARIAEGLEAALATLRDDSADAEQPRLLVLVTDGEDFEAVRRKEQQELVADAGRTPLVRIVTVSLQDGACAPGRFGERLAGASGGRCLDPADDITAELAAEVAKAGTGDVE